MLKTHYIRRQMIRNTLERWSHCTHMTCILAVQCQCFVLNILPITKLNGGGTLLSSHVNARDGHLEITYSSSQLISLVVPYWVLHMWMARDGHLHIIYHANKDSMERCLIEHLICIWPATNIFTSLSHQQGHKPWAISDKCTSHCTWFRIELAGA